MSVRAKFKVESINPSSNGSTIAMSPVVDGSPENDSFYAATPGGKIELSTVNPEAAKQFEAGKEFYVDFNPAS